jgi:acyl-CoA thioesterase-1
LKLDEKGGHQVEIPQYEANLKLIAERLKKTGAKLIWVTTTPVPSGKLSPPRKTEDVVEYNRAAVRVLSDLRVFGWDLYFSVLTRVGELQLKENVHFTPAGYEFLAQQVKIAIPLTGVVDCCLNR